MIQIPDSVWIIFDPLDGPHIYGSKQEAGKDLSMWKSEADDDPDDSVWDMEGPIEYRRQ